MQIDHPQPHSQADPCGLFAEVAVLAVALNIASTFPLIPTFDGYHLEGLVSTDALGVHPLNLHVLLTNPVRVAGSSGVSPYQEA